MQIWDARILHRTTVNTAGLNKTDMTLSFSSVGRAKYSVLYSGKVQTSSSVLVIPTAALSRFIRFHFPSSTVSPFPKTEALVMVP